MAERRHQSGSSEQTDRPLFRHIDDDGVVGLAVAYEGHDAPVASVCVLHRALVAADGQRGHAVILSGRCDIQASVSYLENPTENEQQLLQRDEVGSHYPRHMVHAFVLVDAEPARVADLATELAELDGVAEVYSVAGQADIVAVVRVRRHEQLADVVTRGISRRPGVVDTRTLIAFQSFSRHDLEAMWDIGSGD